MKLLLKIFIPVWAISVAAGTVWIADFASQPGRAADAPKNLRANAENFPSENLPKLLVFLHPQCPCSRATLAELARLNERDKALLSIQVLFFQPSDQPDEWTKTELWRQATAIPNIVVSTIGETELRRFGATTSGQTLLYDASEQLLFNGGITLARGHEGDNKGRESIENYLRTGATTVSQTPVFGCLLTASE